MCWKINQFLRQIYLENSDTIFETVESFVSPWTVDFPGSPRPVTEFYKERKKNRVIKKSNDIQSA